MSVPTNLLKAGECGARSPSSSWKEVSDNPYLILLGACMRQSLGKMEGRGRPGCGEG